MHPIRHDWTVDEARPCSRCPSSTCCSAPQPCTARTSTPNAVQVSTLLSIKTGACPEDCAYCPQSARYDTGLEREQLLQVERRARARAARRRPRAPRASAWARPGARPRTRTSRSVATMVREVRELGLETCATLGMLTPAQAQQLRRRGPRLLQPQPRHLAGVLRRDHHHAHLPGPARHARRGARRAGIKVCCGGIVGMGETRTRPRRPAAGAGHPARAPGSVPINLLVQVPGTPLADAPALDPFEFVRTIAVARILMPAVAGAPVGRPRAA